MWKKCFVVIIGLFLISVCFIPSINGNVLNLKRKNLVNIDHNNENTNSHIKIINTNKHLYAGNHEHLTKDRFGNFKKFDVDKTLSSHGNKENNFRDVVAHKLKTNDFTILDPDQNYDHQIVRLIEKTDSHTVNNNIMKFPLVKSGTIFYVGGSGPDNYTRIQEAIENASNGDTVFVYDDSSPYYENLVIDKSIYLIGENQDCTIINGSKLNSLLDTIEIKANNVYISGLSVVENVGYYYQAAIKVTGDYTTVSNC
jgi:hypothetical protein